VNSHKRSLGARTLTILTLLALLIVLTAALPTVSAQSEHPLAGQEIDMAVLGLAGWLPSSLGVEMASELFAPYALENYGYTVNFSFAGAPFDQLFQLAAASLATRSAEYNIIISDSQWLGALAEPGWIVDIDELIVNGIPDLGIAPQPNLDIDWYTSVVPDTYMTYPNGSGQLWGLPEEGDVQALFVRTDYTSNPDEMAAFEAEYGWPIPQTFEDYENLTMDQFEQLAAFFTRPEDDIYGVIMQHSKGYDYLTMQLYPFMLSRGGQIWNPETRDVYGYLNTPVNAEALEWNRRMLNYGPPGGLDIGIAENVNFFVEGKGVFAIQWAAVGLVMLTDENRDNVIVVPPPTFLQEDGSTNRIWSMGGQPWVLNAYNDAAHMQVAVDFLNWWYLPETQLEYARRGGNPTDAATLNSPEFEQLNPWNQAYKYMLQPDRATDFWHEPNYSEMLALQQEAFSAFASGQSDDPAAVLEWIACQQQAILYDNARTETPAPDSCEDVSY